MSFYDINLLLRIKLEKTVKIKIIRFEDIQAWQEARKLTSMVYKVSSETKIAKDYGLCDQMRRSAISIMSNIAEGYGRRSEKEFVRFLNIAHGSLLELRSNLYVALDLGYLSQDEHLLINKHSEKVGRMIWSLRNHILSKSKPEDTK